MMYEIFPNGQLHAVHTTTHLVVKKEKWPKIRIYMVSWAVANGLTGQDPGKRKHGTGPWYEPMADIREWEQSVKTFVWMHILKHVPQKRH